VDISMALLRHAVTQNIPVAGLPDVLQTLTSLNASSPTVANSGFTNFLSVVLRGELTTTPGVTAGVGGEANTRRRTGDHELETFVASDNFASTGDQRNVEFLSAMFHEGSHGTFGSHRFAYTNNSDLLLMSRTTTLNTISTEASYAAGYNFVNSLVSLKELIRTASPDGRFVVNGRTYDADDLDIDAGDVRGYFYGSNGRSGLFGAAWEAYENQRIGLFRGRLQRLIAGTATLPPNIANNPAVLDDFLARAVADDFLVMKPMQAGLTPEQQLAYRRDIKNYRMGSRSPTDLNGDGVIRNSPSDTGTSITVPYDHPNFRGQVDLFVNSVIEGVLTVDGAQLGLALGSVLGKRLTDDPFGQIAASAGLSTMLGALGEFIDTRIFNGAPSTSILSDGLNSIADTFTGQVLNGGIGAFSSYLTAEVFSALHIGGLPGELGQSIASAYLGAIISNLPALTSGAKTFSEVFNGVRDARGQLIEPGAINLPSLIGSFIGSRLAAEVITFETVGGQIGSAVGGLYGGFAATATLSSLGIAAGMGVTASGTTSAALAAAQFAAANPVVAVAIVAAIVFIDTILGGMIGSLFGGTPRSGADAAWDETKGEFVVSNIYARKGGSKEAAKNLAGAVANNFNALLLATGGTLLDPDAVQSGNYGMRKSDFVYRPASTRDKEAITARFNGDTAPDDLIQHGTYLGLSSMVGQMAGGDAYVKRAFAASLANAGGNSNGSAPGSAGIFDMKTLLGDITVAQDCGRYRLAPTEISALIAGAPQTAFAAGWLITLARAQELGLHRRNATDWTGGYKIFLDEAVDGAIGGQTLTAAQVDMGFDMAAGVRYWTVYDTGGTFLGFVDDSIEVGSHTLIKGTAGSDTIHLSGAHLLAAAGTTNTGLTVNGLAHDGSALKIEVLATVDAGEGDDTVHASDRGDNVFGGAGGDHLYGGKLDDWLIGGDGIDHLYAGSEAGGLGGDGNYLAGGAGDDHLHGREGSDWLEGGEGKDRLVGGAGGDVLAGGAGDADDLEGGSGDDIYLFRRGDGSDAAEDQADVAPVRDSTKAGDAVTQRFAGIAAGSIKRDWLAGSAGVAQGKIAGGEDSIHFGVGIELGDVQLAKAANGRDLIVRLTQVDPATNKEVPTGDVLTIADWFSDPFKRVEWLKFADGTEIRIGDVTSFIVGTGGNDVLIGTAGKDFVYGGAGNDELHLLAGNDIGSGGTGDDMVSGGADHDLVVGGLGADKLIGGSGNDALSGDAGADDLYGGKGNDTLSGGRDDGDVLAGGAGDDRFKFNRGDGHDVVIDDYSDHWATIWQNGQWVNGYQYNAATSEVVAPDGTYVRKNFGTAAAPDLRWVGRFDFDEQTRELKRFNPPAGAATTVSNKGVDTIEWMSGGGGDDVLAGGAGDDIVVGNSGSDRLKGESGNDVLYGGAGNDVLDGGVGDDVLSGGAGTDTASYASAAGGVSAFLTEPQMNRGDALLDSYDGIENLLGGAGADTLGGDDGDNELAGGMGDDLLLGGRGSDTYVWNIGDGSDSIDDTAFTARQVIGSGGELLEGYDAAWTRGDYRSGSGSNTRYYWKLVVTGPDGVVVYSHDRFARKGDAPPMPAVKSWPADGWMAGLESSGVSVGGIVYDRNVDAGEADAIELGAGISLSDLAFERDGNDLVISYVKVEDGNNGGGNAVGASKSSSLSVRGHFTANGRIESLIFADGLSVPLDSILTAATSDLTTGTAGADLMTGQRGVRIDRLDGGDGNDVLAGGEGDDVLSGSAGDDVLEGGAGADTLDGGASTPYDPAAATGAGGRRGDEVRYSTSIAGATIDLASTAAQSGGDAQGDIIRNVENLTGSAHADTLRGDSEANRLRGLAGDDQIEGRDGDDVLIGGSGNDGLQGDAGEDNVSGGDGDDRLLGGSGRDLLAGDSGNDHLSGDEGDDTLSGDSGDDQLQGGLGNDSLVAGEGADLLLGGEGNDMLAGEAGNDDLQGGAGDDGYFFKAGFGNDVITDAQCKNEILMDSSIAHDRLWLEQKGEDLLITVRGSSDTLTVKSFFGASAPSTVHSIQTATHRLFLHHPDTRNFIAAMTAASAAGIPSEIPAAVRALMPRYWHSGTKATPYAVDIALAIDEDHDTGSVQVGAIDHDDNIAGYTLGTGPAHGTVAIDQNGTFRFTPTANFNGFDSFTLIVSDADTLAREIKVSVTVAAVDDAPVIEAAILAIDEQALRSATRTGDRVATLVANELDGEAIVFSLTDDAGGRFTISADGKLDVRDADRLDHESAAAHDVTVRITDAAGTFTERTFSVTIGDVNEENRLPDGYAWNVDENSAAGTIVGQVVAEDVDKANSAFGEQRYWFWHSDAAHELSSYGRYRIDALTGEITLAVTVDHEAPAPISQHQVIARDDRGAAGGHESRTSVTIAITDINEANSIPASHQPHLRGKRGGGASDRRRGGD
jgi:Ca2+-binding RTX toxin-like protein